MIKTSATFPFLIGVSGTARSGKNTYAQFLSAYLLKNSKLPLNIKEFSLAGCLKEECKQLVQETHRLDVFSEKTEDKNVFRQTLVDYAEQKRRDSKGTYFIDKLKSQIWLWYERKHFSPRSIAIITDVRFKEFEYDELDFVKKHGILIHLSRLNENGILPPANDKERQNDPIIKLFSDFKILWRDLGLNKNTHPRELESLSDIWGEEIGSLILKELD